MTIEGARATTDPVLVSVYNSYQQKWLGPSGWQPNKAEMPARAATQDGDRLRLIVGPDIVNQIEEDTPIRIEVGGTGWDTYWPDDINAGPDEAVVGDIGGTGAAPVAKKPTAEIVEHDPEPLDDALTETDSAEVEEDAGDYDDEDDEGEEAWDTEDDTERRPRWKLLLALMTALVLAAVVANYLLFGMDPEPAPQPGPDPDRTTVVQPDGCQPDDLAALQNDGFSAVAGKIRDCGSSLTADNALRYVEQGAAANDPEALALFGALYDNGVTDDAIEGTIGLTFSDAPARAAEYYARAVAAGSDTAKTRLEAVCRRLLLKSDTLSQSAREDYCQ